MLNFLLFLIIGLMISATINVALFTVIYILLTNLYGNTFLYSFPINIIHR